MKYFNGKEISVGDIVMVSCPIASPSIRYKICKIIKIFHETVSIEVLNSGESRIVFPGEIRPYSKDETTAAIVQG